jgi:hypothetical protein
MIFALTGPLLGLRERGNGARIGMPGTHVEAEGHAGVPTMTCLGELPTQTTRPVLLLGIGLTFALDPSS